MRDNTDVVLLVCCITKINGETSLDVSPLNVISRKYYSSLPQSNFAMRW